jgi:hypothetical protein
VMLRLLLSVLVIALVSFSPSKADEIKGINADPLPSWNSGDVKSSIIEFVSRITDRDGREFVPASERIATFDNDGTLWPEQPVYFQLLFAIDRVKSLAPRHPEWKTKEPFASLLRGDLKAALEGGEHAVVELVMATHAGMSTDEFERIVTDWILSAKHPTTGKAYTDMVYQPMLELLNYLRVNGFKTYIVSGGGVDFMRPWVERVYGIPPEQVIGSSVKVRYDSRDGRPVLIRQAEINFVNDKEGKPVGIHNQIGRRPIAAFGNSDGDLQMIKWSTSGGGARFGMLLRHTDAQREWSYDRQSKVGRLDRGLEEAKKMGWTVINMARDWRVVYSGERP